MSVDAIYHSILFAAAIMLSLLGYSGFSRAGQNGMCTFGVVSRCIGLRKDSNASSATMADISDATLLVLWALSTIISRPVLLTDFVIVFLSRGTKVRESITSTDTPCFSSD